MPQQRQQQKKTNKIISIRLESSVVARANELHTHIIIIFIDIEGFVSCFSSLYFFVVVVAVVGIAFRHASLVLFPRHSHSLSISLFACQFVSIWFHWWCGGCVACALRIVCPDFICFSLFFAILYLLSLNNRRRWCSGAALFHYRRHQYHRLEIIRRPYATTISQTEKKNAKSWWNGTNGFWTLRLIHIENRSFGECVFHFGYDLLTRNWIRAMFNVPPQQCVSSESIL